MNIGNNPGARPTWNNNYGPASQRGPLANDQRGRGEDGLDLSDIAHKTMDQLKDRKPLLHLLQQTQPVQHHFNTIA